MTPGKRSNAARLPWPSWSVSGRRTTLLPPPSPGLTLKPTSPTSNVRRTPPTRGISSQTWGRALDWTTPPSTAPWTTRSTGIRELAIALLPGTAPSRDHRRPGVEGDSAGHDGGSRRGPGDAKGSGTSRHNGAGSRGKRGKGSESSSTGRNRRNRPPGDASRASYSSSSTDGSRRSPVPEITGLLPARGKWLPRLLALIIPPRFLAA